MGKSRSPYLELSGGSTGAASDWVEVSHQLVLLRGAKLALSACTQTRLLSANHFNRNNIHGQSALSASNIPLQRMPQ